MNLVMIVNDNPAHLALLMVHLMKLNHPVLGSSCGLAPKVLEHVMPRLIFIEAWPPFDNVVTILPMLREALNGTHVPIVALCPKVSSDAAEILMEAGADALYQDPKDVNQLKTLLSQYLD